MANESPSNINFLIQYGHVITYSFAKLVTKGKAFQSNSLALLNMKDKKNIVANYALLKETCKLFACRFHYNVIFAFKPCRTKNSLKNVRFKL